MIEKHVSVLLNEAIESLNIKDGGTYVDLTLGRDGHSKEILKRIPNGKLYSFDKDEDAIKQSEEVLSKVGKNYKIIRSDFRFFRNELEKLGIEVTKNVAKTGVVGLIKGGHPGKTVALRADMDALRVNEESNCEFKSKVPGVMHACGHDGHTASLLGVAMMLNEIKDELHGNVKLVFQPAE